MTISAQLYDPVYRPPEPSFAPELAYGRHRGPWRESTRRAAVAVCLYDHPQLGWTIPLTRRPTTLRHHGGQICLPGGRIEKGETSQEAALREFEEELGVFPRLIAVGQPLPMQYVYASDNLVVPELLWIECPTHPWRPCPEEVAEVIELPLSHLIGENPRTLVVQRRPLRDAEMAREIVGEIAFSAPAYQYGRWSIWGATAMILHHLARRLLSDSVNATRLSA